MADETGKSRSNPTTVAAIVGAVVVALIMVVGTLWTSRAAAEDTEQAVHSVSLLYLDELAGRREQVVASNLATSVRDINAAVDLMTADDLIDDTHLSAYQAHIKKLYNLEKFAFVDARGIMHTALGIQDNIGDYAFDYQALTGPDISILDLEDGEKRVVIAVPVDIPFGDTTLVACFEEIDMDEMLSGVSMSSSADDATFCNLYTKDGVALSNIILAGRATEDNLLDAMRTAEFEGGYSYEQFVTEFSTLTRGEVSFTYDGTSATLAYVPVEGTNWLLTYLVLESRISEEISQISSGIVVRGAVQTVITALALTALFSFVIAQNRARAREQIEQETRLAEQRTHQTELEARIELQDRLLEEEHSREEQNRIIASLAADYRSVYYVTLDTQEGVCYQPHRDIDDGVEAGQHFDYLKAMQAYTDHHIVESFREEVMRFVQPETIRENLADAMVTSCRYLVERDGREVYEVLRIAGVRHVEDRDDGTIHAISACMANVDAETRAQLAQNQALADALAAAERASRAKTTFLSNMSHEIRTPMNAIIGLDSIALADPEISDATRDYLSKIGESADHLLSLINDILDMSRIESGNMVLKNGEFSFPKLLEAVNTLFFGQCEDKGLDFGCHVIGEVDDYYVGDAMKLRQVLINILGNAVKFTPEGGSVELTVERRARFGDQTTLSFTIADTGIGMGEDFLPHIFDAFAQEDASSTSRYGSSGLGLAITKSIVEMMNGDIQVMSEKGVGTTFVVTVTLQNSSQEAHEFDLAIDPTRMSVLVVDDDSVATEHAGLVLGRAGISCESAHSGAQAIEMVRLRHARHDPYNLILLDWKMPEMDGVACAAAIREIVGNQSAIIILTAYRFDDIVDEAIASGVDSFLPKPLFAGAVVEEFEAAVRRKGLDMARLAEPVDLAGRRVLLAEDVDINAEIMVMVLQMREIEAEWAENGRIAVDMFESHEPGYYDAILMDLRMPEMDGLTATRAIRAMERDDARTIPIIALTANAFDEDVQRSLQAGLDAHLSKPVQPDVLFDTLESLL